MVWLCREMFSLLTVCKAAAENKLNTFQTLITPLSQAGKSGVQHASVSIFPCISTTFKGKATSVPSKRQVSTVPREASLSSAQNLKLRRVVGIQFLVTLFMQRRKCKN